MQKRGVAEKAVDALGEKEGLMVEVEKNLFDKLGNGEYYLD